MPRSDVPSLITYCNMCQKIFIITNKGKCIELEGKYGELALGGV